ncbi:MAG TPA: response regulator [Alphaproteobacteria bacterium]|nr:response regulator [Alphaproteobacteria bacterium]
MPDKTVFVVDDDEGVRKALSFLLRTAGYTVDTFASAVDFLSQYDPARRGCVVLDVRMPRMTGLQMQQQLNSRGWRIPTIFITGHGSIPIAIDALRAGAFEFLEKPLREDHLLESVERAFEQDEAVRRRSAALEEIANRINSLTPRQHEIMRLVVDGEPNKAIAQRLDISFRTVEIHRARVMEKMQARSLSDLVRMVITLESAAKPN